MIIISILVALGYHGSGMCLSQLVLFYCRPLLSLMPVLFVFTNTNFTSWPTWRFLLQFMLPSVNQAFCFVCSSLFINQSNCDLLNGLTLMLAWDWFLTIGLAGLALFQSGRCGANVQHKYLGLLLPGPGRSSTTLPASKQAASPSIFCILYPISWYAFEFRILF